MPPLSFVPMETQEVVLAGTVALLQCQAWNNYDQLFSNHVPGGAPVTYTPVQSGSGPLGNGWWGYAPDYGVEVDPSDTVTVDAHVRMRMQVGTDYDHASPARVLFNAHILDDDNNDIGLVGGQWIPDSTLAIGSTAHPTTIIGYLEAPGLSSDVQEYAVQWYRRPNPDTTGADDAALYGIRVWNLGTGEFASGEWASYAYAGAGNRFVLNPHSMDWPVEGNSVRRIRCTFGEVPDLYTLQVAAPQIPTDTGAVTAVSSRQYEVNLVQAILGMQPSLDLGQAHGWRHSENKSSTPGYLARSFEIAWGDTSTVVGGTTGDGHYEVASSISIVTDYRALPKKFLGELVNSDHQDLLELIQENLDPQIVGHLGGDSIGITETDEDARFNHNFTLRWYRRRMAA